MKIDIMRTKNNDMYDTVYPIRINIIINPQGRMYVILGAQSKIISFKL